MSIEKLLSQADKLLEKGRIEEAIQKFQEALRTDPKNQQANNRLAQAYIANDQANEAVKIFEDLAIQASEAGRSQIAVALLKQALDLDQDNLALMSKLALECEIIGKLSEANMYARQILAYYVARKKHVEALPICGLLARVSPKDDQLKSIWLEILTYICIDERLMPALVYFCGPPGLADPEFPVGGDPALLSEALYNQLKKLLTWYPKNVTIAYALGWAAYKRGNLADAYKFIREAFRRDPDCTLNMLLLARIFSDQKKLNECLFIFKYVKEKISNDKTVEMVTLNKQLALFEEKNGWLTFNEGFGDEDSFTTAKFLAQFEKKGEAEEEVVSENEDIAQEVEAGTIEPVVMVKSDDGTESSHPLTNQADDFGVALPSLGEEKTEILFTSGIVGSIDNEYSIPPPLSAVSPPAAPVVSEAAAVIPEAPAVILKEPEETEETVVISSVESAPDPIEALITGTTKLSESEAFLSPLEALQASAKAFIYPVESPAIPEAPPVVASPVEEKMDATIFVAPPAPAEALAPSRVSPIAPLPDMHEQEVPAEGVEKNIAEEEIDLGSDLLEEATKREEVTKNEEKGTSLLVAELKKEEITAENMLRKGERFLAKRNYYLARKSFRQALALGADEDIVKDKLRTIRTMEMPDSMYVKISSDKEPSTNVDDVVRALEIDFDIEEELHKKEALGKFNKTKFRRIMKDVDARTCIDLGVAFFEMSLYKDAENIFAYAVQQDETIRFEAFYLMAETMMARKDYAAAVNALKALAVDKAKEEKEKLPIYYLLGQAFEKMHQPKRSKKYYEKVANLNANYRDVREKLGLS